MAVSAHPHVERQRWRLLSNLVRAADGPLAVLGLLWLVLIVVDLVHGLSPLLDRLSLIVWALFAFQFAAEFTIAPRKLVYLRHHWLAAASLAVPALRVARVARAVRVVRMARIARGSRMIRLLGSTNRVMGALRATMARRGFTYIVALSSAVLLAGAAGMESFERGVSPAFSSFGSSLWWTAMILTTMGSEAWPHTAAGRILCLLLSLYAFAVFGYITAMLATFFIDRDADDAHAAVAGAKALQRIEEELAAIHARLDDLARP
jgi:voltage-gated potassium channel